jgi:hypothetical protein
VIRMAMAALAMSANVATGGWQTYQVPVTGNANLDAVVAPGADDAWAGGFTVKPADRLAQPRSESDCQASQGMFGTVMLHWNGAQWQKVSVPASGRVDYMSAASATDIWAVTDCNTLHWNGRTWSSVAIPEPSGPNLQAAVASVSADRAGDAWALGTTYVATTGAEGSFVDHWNGKTWLRVKLPSLGTTTGLEAISATSPSNVWAVGTSGTAISAPMKLVLLHWNGRTWTRVTAPATGQWFMTVSTMTSISAKNIWLTGWGKVTDDRSSNRIPLLLHWDGKHWTKTGAPAGRGELFQIAVTGGVPWAVGDTYSPSATTWSFDVLRWDGTRWVHTTPPVQGNYGSLSGLAARPGGGLWAVGTIENATYTTLKPLIALHT